jgi:hypothetical protein
MTFCYAAGGSGQRMTDLYLIHIIPSTKKGARLQRGAP